jgi:hypothetical protein
MVRKVSGEIVDVCETFVSATNDDPTVGTPDNAVVLLPERKKVM